MSHLKEVSSRPGAGGEAGGRTGNAAARMARDHVSGRHSSVWLVEQTRRETETRLHSVARRVICVLCFGSAAAAAREG